MIFTAAHPLGLLFDPVIVAWCANALGGAWAGTTLGHLGRGLHLRRMAANVETRHAVLSEMLTAHGAIVVREAGR